MVTGGLSRLTTIGVSGSSLPHSTSRIDLDESPLPEETIETFRKNPVLVLRVKQAVPETQRISTGGFFFLLASSFCNIRDCFKPQLWDLGLQSGNRVVEGMRRDDVLSNLA